MCGIAGIWARQSSAGATDVESVTQSMACAIGHRGPDGQGVWADAHAGVALGHRRLAIIDLSVEGNQPMQSPSGRWMLVFNGEIYNFEDLRRQLPGRAWRGHSDTEVLLAGIDEWGLDEALKRCAGMFAMALFDREERRLHLVRDRIGEKPLYVGWVGGNLVFASELKALRVCPGWQGEIDRGALALFLRYGYVPAPHSIFQGIGKVMPGTILSFGADDTSGAGTSRAYWSADAVTRQPPAYAAGVPQEQIVTEFDALLTTTVGQQMISDVPLGAFLSGGIDSSLIVSMMQKQSPRPVKTFTIGFQERAFDEAPHAAAVAKHLGTDHTELYVSPADALAVIPKLPAIYDEPFADSSQIPTFLVSELARRHVTVSLSGDGGDELFGGYSRYFIAQRMWAKMGRVPKSARALTSHTALALAHGPLAGVLPRLGRMAPARHQRFFSGYRYQRLAALLGARNHLAMYREVVSQTNDPAVYLVEGAEPRHALQDLTARPEASGFFRQMMGADLISYLPDDILVKVDRAAMAVSLESRAPFLDHRIVEFAWGLPDALRGAPPGGKQILRALLGRYVPRSLFERPKMGFGVPVHEWLRGPLREWAESLLNAPNLEATGFFKTAAVRRLWAEHQSGHADWSSILWSVLMFMAWYESQHAVAVPEVAAERLSVTHA